MMMQSNTFIQTADIKTQNEVSMQKISQKGLMVPSISVEQGTKPSETSSVPALLLELVTIVSQIAQLDAMFDKVKGNAPEAGSEADKWHQVSVQALETSRKYMVEQQTSLIKRLGNSAGLPVPKQSGTVALKPVKDDVPVAKEACASPPPGLCPPPGLDAPPGLDIAEDTAQEASSLAKDKRPLADAEGHSLRTDLEKIKMYEPGRALLVRKIKPLGFDSAEHLRNHFEQFGQVTEVLVSHCITKPSPKRANGRVRPAALGFVVMATSEAGDKVFAQGDQHFIQANGTSVNVEVSRFRDGSQDSSEPESEETL